jgi:hypothetical protein
LSFVLDKGDIGGGGPTPVTSTVNETIVFGIDGTFSEENIYLISLPPTSFA